VESPNNKLKTREMIASFDAQGPHQNDAPIEIQCVVIIQANALADEKYLTATSDHPATG
jgi:hypothetical protein